MSEARRYNKGKLELSRMRDFGVATRGIVKVMMQGAVKYADGNWKLGGKKDQEYLDSHDRHLQAFHEGQYYDPDSGTPHLAHAIWNLMALMELNYYNYPEIDPCFDQEAYEARWSGQKESE